MREKLMNRYSRRWRIGAGVFALVNVLGFFWAISQRETMHAAVHFGLLCAMGVFTAAQRSFGSRPYEPQTDRQAEQHLDHLQHALDGIALDVERIGESQRYAMKILEERARASATENP
jgi:hypothetical protein